MSEATAAGGQALASPNRKWATGGALAAPADYVEFIVDAPSGVPYHLWLRLRAAADSTANDSVFVQYSDAIASGAPLYPIGSTQGVAVELENCKRCGVAGWGWQDDRYNVTQVTTVTFATNGPHTVRIQTREDGVQLDQLVLSPVGLRTSAPGSPTNDATIVPKAMVRAAPTPYLGIMAVLPGLVDATRYDDGGAGVAYYDTTAGNAGATFRSDDVDVETGSEGGNNIGWMVAGEWLKYTVTITEAGAYQLQVRVASPGAGGSLHFNLDGAAITGPLALPDTGGWQQWQTLSVAVTLPAGVHVLTLVCDSNGVTGSVGNVAWFGIETARPFDGTPMTIPGTIPAERFDNGGEGVSYHDTSAGNLGGAFRSTAVDIEARSGGGYDVGYTADGEWMDYSVRITETGAYTLTVAVATPLAGPAMHVEIGGQSLAIPIPVTGGWQTFTTVSVPLSLKVGLQRLHVVFDTGGVNLGAMIFALAVAPPPPPPPPPPDAPPGTIVVGPADDLQAAIDRAVGGNIILLTAGATYLGNFVLPVKSGSDFIIIRSNTPDTQLPNGTSRITPAAAPLLARLQSPNSSPALRTEAGAHHYKLLFLEFGNNSGGYGDIVDFGDGSSAQNTLAQVPHDLVIDRCYLHGDPAIGQKRGVGLNSASTTITNSWFADFKLSGFDTQAIAGWNGPGPYVITNNYLEAAGENVMFGGSDASIPNLVPSDITVRGNYFSRPLAWRSQSWTIKNIFELKNAQRVVIDGNIFENHWAQAQPGYAIVFTPRNQDGNSPWSVVQQVRFTNNVVRNVSSVFNILGRDDAHPSLQANDIYIANNLFENVSTAFGGSGRFMLIAGAANVTVDHNTVLQDGWTSLYSDQAVSPGFVFTNNIIPDYSWAVMGVNTSPGNGTIAAYFPNGQFLNGVYAGSPAWSYPVGNFYPAAYADVGFVNLAGRNYRLAATSPYHNSATDGTDVGCLIDRLNAAAGTAY